MKKKPGPKPKSFDKKARGKSLSFPAVQADFLDSLDEPSPLMQKLLAQSPEFQEWLKRSKCSK